MTHPLIFSSFFLLQIEDDPPLGAFGPSFFKDDPPLGAFGANFFEDDPPLKSPPPLTN